MMVKSKINQFDAYKEVYENGHLNGKGKDYFIELLEE